MHGRPWILISSVRRGSTAMGFSSWALVIVGALVGQAVTLLNVVLLVGWRYLTGDNWEVIVEQVVHRALQDCLEHDIVTATTSTPEPSLPSGHLFTVNIGIHLILIFVILVLVGILTGIVVWKHCCPGSVANSVEDRDIEGTRSPDSSPVEIRTLARHQLAEIRLRHAHKPLRISGV